MKEFLFLFHSTVGVIQTRKALQAAGMTFRVSDIPRDLRGGCGLCIWLTCPRRGNTMGDPWANRSDILPAGQRLAVRGALRCRSVNQAIRSLNITRG